MISQNIEILGRNIPAEQARATLIAAGLSLIEASATAIPEEALAYPPTNSEQADTARHIGAMLNVLDDKISQHGPDMRTTLSGLSQAASAEPKPGAEAGTDTFQMADLLIEARAADLVVAAYKTVGRQY